MQSDDPYEVLRHSLPFASRKMLEQGDFDGVERRMRKGIRQIRFLTWGSSVLCIAAYAYLWVWDGPWYSYLGLLMPTAFMLCWSYPFNARLMREALDRLERARESRAARPEET